MSLPCCGRRVQELLDAFQKTTYHLFHSAKRQGETPGRLSPFLRCQAKPVRPPLSRVRGPLPRKGRFFRGFLQFERSISCWTPGCHAGQGPREVTDRDSSLVPKLRLGTLRCKLRLLGRTKRKRSFQSSVPKRSLGTRILALLHLLHPGNPLHHQRRIAASRQIETQRQLLLVRVLLVLGVAGLQILREAPCGSLAL